MSSNSSTRKRTTSLTTSETADNLPPQRRLNTENKLNPLLRNVNPPLSNTRLSTLIYVLVGLTTLLTVYYSYRSMQYKSEVGGWWSLVLGRRPPEMQTDSSSSSSSSNSKGFAHSNSNTNSDTIESHILALAAALGMPTHELASAIASAVRAHVPPASLSSIKAHETGDAVSVLLQEQEQTPTSYGGGAWGAASTAAGVVEGVVGGVESFVGMDEP